MASDSDKLERLKSILAKRSPSSNSRPATAAEISDIATTPVSSQGTRAVAGAAQVDRIGNPWNGSPLQRAMPSAVTPAGRGQLLLCTQAVRQPGQAANGASKLDRLKAVLDDNQRRKSATPLGVASPPAAPWENAPSDCGSPAAQSCDGRETSDQAGVTKADTMTAEPSERAKRFKELLAKQAQKKSAQLSDMPPPLKRASECHKGPRSASVSDSSESLTPENPRTVERIPWARLPVGERVPVVFLGIGDQGKVVYLQELSAQSDLVEMIRAMNLEVPKDGRPVGKCTPGTHVAILRTEDMTLYRGRICDTGSSLGDAGDAGGDRCQDKVRVLFVDYGRQEDVSPDHVHRLPVAFELLPAYAIPVRLAGVPVLDLPDGVSLDGTLLDAQVVAVDSFTGLQSVRLYIRYNDLCLNDSLALSAKS